MFNSLKNSYNLVFSNKKTTTDTLWNIFGATGMLILGLACIPYLLKFLSAQNFNILSILWAAIGFIYLFDFGIVRASTFYFKRFRSASREVFLYFLVIIVTISLFCFIVLKGFIYFQNFLNKEVIEISNYFSFSIIFFLIAGFNKGFLIASERFRFLNIYNVLISSFLFSPAFYLIYTDSYTLTGFVQIFISLTAALHTVIFLYLFSQTRSNRKLKKSIKKILIFMRYGGWLICTNFSNPILINGDRMMIPLLINTTNLQFYVVPQMLLQKISILPQSISLVFLPKLISSNKKEKKAIFFNTLKLITYALCILLTVILLFLEIFFSLWISSDFASRAMIFSYIFLIGIFFNSLATFSYNLLLALKKTKIIGLTHIFEVLIFILLFIFLTNAFGLIGSAIAWSLRLIVDFILMTYFAVRYLEKSQ